MVLRWAHGGAGLLIEDSDPDDPTVLMSEDDAKVFRAVAAAHGPVSATDLVPMLDGMPKIGTRLVSLRNAGHLRRLSRGMYET